MAGTPKPFTRWAADTRTAFLLGWSTHASISQLTTIRSKST